MIGRLEDQLIVCLFASDAMIENSLASVGRKRIVGRPRALRSHVEETSLVLGRPERRILDSLELFAEVLIRPHLTNANGSPGGSLGRNSVGEVASVGRRRLIDDRDEAVLGEGVDVDQHARDGIEALLHVKGRLILQTAVLVEEESLTRAEWGADFRILPRRGDEI